MSDEGCVHRVFGGERKNHGDGRPREAISTNRKGHLEVDVEGIRDCCLCSLQFYSNCRSAAVLLP